MSKTSQREASAKFAKARETQRRINDKRIQDMQAKITIGTAQVIAAIKKLPFEERMMYCKEIMDQAENLDYDADGRYIGEDATAIAAQQDLDTRGFPLVDDLPQAGEPVVTGDEPEFEEVDDAGEKVWEEIPENGEPGEIEPTPEAEDRGILPDEKAASYGGSE